MNPHAYVVVGLGYGDEGKGTMVDFLAREHDARLVVRYNGGPQAAHNVVLSDGREHQFHCFGSASFLPHVRTHLSAFTMIEPYGMTNEVEDLGADIWERTTVSPMCTVVTPYHWILNQMRERQRGGSRHGSCGYGVGELRRFMEEGLPTLRAWELSDEMRTRVKLRSIKAIALAEADHVARRDVEEEDPAEVGAFYFLFSTLAKTKSDDDVRRELTRQVTIFEGAQGVLLDEKYGVEPHRTWTNTTPHNAHQLIAGTVPTTTVGVIRTFMTRHGPGPFVTEDAINPPWDLPKTERNGWSEFQREFRVGWFDLPLFRYALRCAGTVDTIALTHCDWWRQGFRYAVEYTRNGEPTREITPDWEVADFASCRPVYSRVDGKPVHELFSKVTGRKVGYASHGPTEKDKVRL